MAREMTPQERAATFIKSTFPLHLREDGEPCDGDIEDVVAHDKETRRAALLEAREVVLAEVLEDILDNEADEAYNMAIGHAAHALDRLAQEGS